MPRDSSGNYTLPAGNPVEGGTLITDTWANPTMDDLGAALTDSLSRSGSGGMEVAFENADGTVGAPGITWTSDTASGWYKAAPVDFRYSISGVDVLRVFNGSLFIWDVDLATFQEVLVEGGAGVTVWGTISGTLSDQLDLQSALDSAGVTADWGAIDGTLADQLDLQAALDDKIGALVEDPGPTLANILDVGPYGFGVSFTTSIGNDFVIGDVGYVNSSGAVSLAQANAEETTKGELVMALAVITGGNPGAFMSTGAVAGLAGLTGGSTYYLSAATAGKITNVAPTGAGEFVRVIGYTASLTTEVQFIPGGTWIKLA